MSAVLSRAAVDNLRSVAEAFASSTAAVAEYAPSRTHGVVVQAGAASVKGHDQRAAPPRMVEGRSQDAVNPFVPVSTTCTVAPTAAAPPTPSAAVPLATTTWLFTIPELIVATGGRVSKSEATAGRPALPVRSAMEAVAVKHAAPGLWQSGRLTVLQFQAPVASDDTAQAQIPAVASQLQLPPNAAHCDCVTPAPLVLVSSTRMAFCAAVGVDEPEIRVPTTVDTSGAGAAMVGAPAGP